MITIATLKAAGLSDAQIVRVLEIEQQEKVAARRERNRINQQNHRARKRVSADSGDIADISPPPETPKAKLFRVGKATLLSFGISEKQTGNLIGQWLKRESDPAKVLSVIELARDRDVAGPVAYITAALNKDGVNGKRRNGSTTLGELSQQLADEAYALEHPAGLHRSPAPVGGDRPRDADGQPLSERRRPGW